MHPGIEQLLQEVFVLVVYILAQVFKVDLFKVNYNNFTRPKYTSLLPIVGKLAKCDMSRIWQNLPMKSKGFFPRKQRIRTNLFLNSAKQTQVRLSGKFNENKIQGQIHCH